MNEATVRQISQSTDLGKYTREQCHMADAWIKDYAMVSLQRQLCTMPMALREYVLAMAQYHYGSIETDEMLTKLNCFPKWMSEEAKP